MSEAETKEVVVEEAVQTQEEQKQSTPDPLEQRALEMGWRPKEEFEGDEEDFIDAKEFVRRKPLFEKIDSVGKELKETRKALKLLQEHHAKVRESEFKNALEQLRKEKKQALEDGDAERLIEIDEQISDAKVQRVVSQQQARQEAATPHPNFVAWVNRNSWYKENAELKITADQIGTSYAAMNPDKDPDEILKYVEGRIKKLYPENFRNPNKDKPSAVEGRGNDVPRKPTSSEDDYQLSDEERKAMNTFIRAGIMTKQEYINELKRVKGE